MAKKLRRLEIREVALVDDGGNQLADIVFSKRKDPQPEAKKMDPVTTPAPVTTAAPQVPEEISKALSAQATEIEKQRAANEQLRQEVAKLQALQEEASKREEIAKCAQYSGVKPEGLPEKLVKLRKIDATLYDDVHAVLAAASEIAKAGTAVLTKEVGSSKDPGARTESAIERADALAKQLVAEGKFKDHGSALIEVFKTNRALYSEVDRESVQRVSLA